MGGRKVNLDTLEYLFQNLGNKTKGMKTKSWIIIPNNGEAR